VKQREGEVVLASDTHLTPSLSLAPSPPQAGGEGSLDYATIGFCSVPTPLADTAMTSPGLMKTFGLRP
jgi:hypothetical protein